MKIGIVTIAIALSGAICTFASAAPTAPAGAAPPPAATPAPAKPAATVPAPVAAMPAAPAMAPRPPGGIPAAPPVCMKEFLDPVRKKAADVPLGTSDLEAMCDHANDATLESQIVQTCPQVDIHAFLKHRAKVCEPSPQSGSSPELEQMARVFNAVAPQLVRAPAIAGHHDGVAGINPACLTPCIVPCVTQRNGAQGLGATEVAQGVGDFLTSRAEREVSAYATVELFSRICASEISPLLPATCDLLEAQDEGAGPVGLGLLQRKVTEDLESAPLHALTVAMSKATDKTQKDLICTADAAYAITRAVLAGATVDATLLTEARKLAAITGTTCDDVWKALGRGALVAAHVTELQNAVVALRAAQGAPALHTARAAVVAAVVTLHGDLDTDATHTELVKEAAAITTAAWNEAWLDLISAVASAKSIGHRAVCNNPSTDKCPAFDKGAIVLGIIGDIATSKDSEGVQATLERVAEPIGTWRRKFEEHSVTFSLNGYAGAKVASEWLNGESRSFTLAPNLAVGLEVTFPGTSGHVRFFGQAIDVGNVASVRLADTGDNLTKVEAQPNIDFPQLFAPGGYFLFAPAKAPFVIGVGANWVPKLRKTVGGDLHSALQVGVTLSVDVPILELAHE